MTIPTIAPTGTEGPEALVVPARFCGPAASGNGGWTSGSLAQVLDPDHARAVTVALRMPPPLDTAISLEHTETGLTASHDGRPVASARLADADPVPVAPVDLETARTGEAAYPGLRSHPFPSCVSCGTEREPGDGLRIFPGPVDGAPGTGRAAATWTPHPSVVEDFHTYDEARPQASLAVTWAALDCAGAWGADGGERLMVLGTMTAVVHHRPVIGEPHVVVGEGRGQEGRKTFSAASVYDARGRLLGTAEHVWIAVDPAFFA